MYLPAITAPLASGDGVLYSLYSHGEDYSWEGYQGRFMIHYWDRFGTYRYVPSLSIILLITFISIIFVIIIRSFANKTSLVLLFIPFFLFLNQNIESLSTYYYCEASYSFAHLLGVLAFLAWIKGLDSKNWIKIIVGFLLLIMATSTYQSYITVATTFCLIALLFELLYTEKESSAVLKKGALLLLFSGATLIIYRVYLTFRSSKLSDYHGISTMESSMNPALIPKSIVTAYSYFVMHFFSKNEFINNAWNSRGKINIIVFGIFAAIIAYHIFKIKKSEQSSKLLKSVLIVAICLILPLSIRGVNILAPQVSSYADTGSLMFPTNNYIYIIVALMINNSISINTQSTLIKKCLYSFGAVVMAAYALISISYHIVFEDCMRIKYDMYKTAAYRVVSELDRMGYTYDTPLSFYGSPEDMRGAYNLEEYDDILIGTIAPYDIIWRDNTDAFSKYFNDYLGIDYMKCEFWHEKDVRETEQVKNMPVFPEEGSIQEVDGTLVVKLSE